MAKLKVQYMAKVTVYIKNPDNNIDIINYDDFLENLKPEPWRVVIYESGIAL